MVVPRPILARAELCSSQLAFRIHLALQRTAAYPLHKLDFIMMDLERPDLCQRHASFCTGDLTGRLLDLLSSSATIGVPEDPRLGELFERILRTRRPSGLFGRYAHVAGARLPPEELPERIPGRCSSVVGADRLFNGLISYYELSRDWRALEGAIGVGDWFVRNRDRWAAYFRGIPFALEYWITEPLARLFEITQDGRYIDFCAMIHEAMDASQIQSMHAHSFLVTLRGFQRLALYTGDLAWNEKPEYYRRRIISEGWEMPDGCLSEVLPHSIRNEGCCIADWLMVNLYAGLVSGDPECYEKAQHILWNALFFNQFVTGGFGTRDLLPPGSDTPNLAPPGYRSGPISEAWWCCTEHAALAMVEYARHAVIARGDQVCVNQLLPGRYALPVAGRPDIEITISTPFPAEAKARVLVKNLPGDMRVSLRIPTCIRGARIVEHGRETGTEYVLSGELGHHVEECRGGVVLKYGPLILAPLCMYWNTGPIAGAAGVPANYIPGDLPPGIPAIDATDTDPRGFLVLAREPVPDWTYFDEGPGAELWVPGASALVPIRFENGEERTAYWWPLCYQTSNLTYYDTPIRFAFSGGQPLS